MLTYFYFIACETPLESLWILLQLVAFSRGAVKAQNWRTGWTKEESCWKLICRSENQQLQCWKASFADLRSCIPAVYIRYTLIYSLKCAQEAQSKIWVDGSENVLLERDFKLSKVEKQADIQSVYTDIQTRYNINMCKKCDWQGNVEGRLF